MKYSIQPYIFQKNPDVCFGLVIGKGLKNSNTTEEDSARLSESESSVRERIPSDQIKTSPGIAVYREALKNVDINGNKFMNSVEAMSKRIVKGGTLPRINALVDLCNAVALKYLVSLGAHDLRDIHADLAVRISQEGDEFLPFGEEAYEEVAPGEVVFTSGNVVQTRQWLWRQSKLGMIDLDSTDIIFQLVGFKGEHYQNFQGALKEVEALARERFGAETVCYVVDAATPEIEFNR